MIRANTFLTTDQRILVYLMSAPNMSTQRWQHSLFRHENCQNNLASGTYIRVTAAIYFEDMTTLIHQQCFLRTTASVAPWHKSTAPNGRTARLHGWGSGKLKSKRQQQLLVKWFIAEVIDYRCLHHDDEYRDCFSIGHSLAYEGSVEFPAGDVVTSVDGVVSVTSAGVVFSSDVTGVDVVTSVDAVVSVTSAGVVFSSDVTGVDVVTSVDGVVSVTSAGVVFSSDVAGVDVVTSVDGVVSVTSAGVVFSSDVTGVVFSTGLTLSASSPGVASVTFFPIAGFESSFEFSTDRALDLFFTEGFVVLLMIPHSTAFESASLAHVCVAANSAPSNRESAIKTSSMSLSMSRAASSLSALIMFMTM